MAKATQKKKRRLGKGLESLLTRPVEVSPPALVETGSSGDEEKSSFSPEDAPKVRDALAYISIEAISPNPRQPRQVFDDDGLSSLAESINNAGLMQPVVVRKTADVENYELVAGERRWRAAQIAGLNQIPAIIRDLDDRTSAEWALIENLQREDLNPIDRAEAFDRLVVDFGATQQDIANQLGIDRSSVSNFLRLNDLDAPIKTAVRDGRLSMGHAKVLLGIPDASTSKAIARRCASEQWSVRELERQLLRLGKKNKAAANNNPSSIQMYMDNLGDQLGAHLGTKVSVSLGKKKGSGNLIISFFDNDQFEGILDRLEFKPKS
ncbi:MAG: ParB/RepB/Spo0J family partition protein [Phycisphaerales bacterium]|nr:ParB/RepB/Spo0J family partition protein [Phycisphaerales bacterium]